jgi:hypothetical protein
MEDDGPNEDTSDFPRIHRTTERRDDGVTVVREIDPSTGEEVVRRYPPS